MGIEGELAANHNDTILLIAEKYGNGHRERTQHFLWRRSVLLLWLDGISMGFNFFHKWYVPGFLLFIKKHEVKMHNIEIVKLIFNICKVLLIFNMFVFFCIFWNLTLKFLRPYNTK